LLGILCAVVMWLPFVLGHHADPHWHAPILAVIIRKLGKQIRRGTRGALRGQAKLLEDASEVTRGFRVVKAFGGERAELGRFTRDNRELLRDTLRIRTAQALAGPLLETITILVLGGLALVAAKAIIEGSLAPTEFLVTMGALGLAGSSLRPLTALVQDMQVSDAAAARLEELLTAPVEVRRATPRLARHARDIEFRGVSFTYPGRTAPAIDGVSLRIVHGQRVARDLLAGHGAEEHQLEGLADGALTAPGGVIRYRGREIRRKELRGVIEAVRTERRSVEQRILDHDRTCRATHLAAANLIGHGWNDHLQGLVELLHFAAHSLRNLSDAHSHLHHVLDIVLADGNVSSSERKRVLSSADDLYLVITRLWQAKQRA
jgi:ABC-type multidrug transport system fused ATPase/permease subunit